MANLTESQRMTLQRFFEEKRNAICLSRNGHNYAAAMQLLPTGDCLARCTLTIVEDNDDSDQFGQVIWKDDTTISVASDGEWQFSSEMIPEPMTQAEVHSILYP